MKKTTKQSGGRTRARRRAAEPLRAEYDSASGARGKDAKRVRNNGTYLVLLDPDLGKKFRSERDVNRALREYLRNRTE